MNKIRFYTTAMATVALLLTSVSRSEQIGSAQQSWQAREASLFATVKRARAGDVEAQKAFDQILSEYETKPMTRTPMENIDILGLFYVPNEGAERCMPVVVMNAALGWYDALRYGSESGREELMSNRKFFLRAFLIDSEATTNKSILVLKAKTKSVAASVEQGLKMAEKWKDAPGYDHTWIRAFGLESMIGKMGGSSAVTSLAKDKWDAAWESTKKRVREYYVPDSP